MKKLLMVLFILVSFTSVFAADVKKADVKAADVKAADAKAVEVKAADVKPAEVKPAPTALKITGDFTMEGTGIGNEDLQKDNSNKYYFFDYDLNINASLIVNPNATIITRLTYDKNVVGTASVAKVEGTNQENSKSVLAVERAYLAYKFNPMFQLDAGLMGGGQWGTLFGNTESNVIRVKGTATVSPDMVFYAIYQKNTEGGAPTSLVDSAATTSATDTGEKNDSNTYYLGAKIKAGPVAIIPLFWYGLAGTGYSVDRATSATGAVTGLNGDATTMAADVAITGAFGAAGFESEFVYNTVKYKGDAYTTKNDVKTYGAYVNLFAKVDPAKAGLVVAYASADKTDGSYSWGKDFDVTVVTDDWLEATLSGWTIIKPYVDLSFGPVSCGLAYAYGMDNIKDGKASFSEIDANVAYEFDANTSYSISGGYAMTSKMNAVAATATTAAVAGTKANTFVIYNAFKITF